MGLSSGMRAASYFLLLLFACASVSHAIITKREDVDIPTKVIIVQPGDTLRKLAAKHLGDADRWREFFKVNRFSNPDVLSPGERLYVPLEKPVPQGATKQGPPSPSETAPSVVQPEQASPGKVDVPRAVAGRSPARILWLTEQEAWPVRMPILLRVRVEDAEGNPVPGARLEWVLHTFPEAVGDLIEADPGDATPGSVASGGGSKRTNHYGVTRTGAAVRPLLGESDSPLIVGVGESWVVIEASRPGTTDLTVFCPDIPRSGERQIRRTLYWSDLAWDIPERGQSTVDFSEGASNTAPIHVQLRHKIDGTPASDIPVRYTILLDGLPALFQDGSRQSVVISDSEGKASANLNLAARSGGTAQVQIEVLDAYGHPLARKVYRHLWMGAALQTEMEGPEIVGLQHELQLELRVTNGGTSAATAVKCSGGLPTEGLELLGESSTLSGDGQLHWEIGDLSPGQRVARPLRFRAVREGLWSFRFQLTSEEGVQVEVTKDVAVVKPQLQLKLEGPDHAQVDDTLEYALQVSNLSEVEVTYVEVNCSLPSEALELIEAVPDGGVDVSSLVWLIESLEAGESRQIKLALRARTRGQWTLTASADCYEGAQREVSRTLYLGAPKLSLALKAQPAILNLDQRVQLTLQLQNEGDVPATGVVLATKLPPALTFVRSSEDGKLTSDGLITWDFPRLNPGDERRIVLTVTGKTFGKHVARASVTSDQQQNVSAESTVTVIAQPELKVSSKDNRDPIRVGEEVTYSTTIENIGRGNATGVRLSAVLPASLRIIDANASRGKPSIQSNHIELTIERLPPGQQVIMTVRALALEAGDVVYSALLMYNEFSQPMRAEEATVVAP